MVILHWWLRKPFGWTQHDMYIHRKKISSRFLWDKYTSTHFLAPWRGSTYRTCSVKGLEKVPWWFFWIVKAFFFVFLGTLSERIPPPKKNAVEDLPESQRSPKKIWNWWTIRLIGARNHLDHWGTRWNKCSPRKRRFNSRVLGRVFHRRTKMYNVVWYWWPSKPLGWTEITRMWSVHLISFF